MGFVAVRNGHRVHQNGWKSQHNVAFLSVKCVRSWAAVFQDGSTYYVQVCMYSKCTRTDLVSLQKSGQAKIRPAQPLATAMHGVLSITITYLSVEAWIIIYGF